MPIFRRTKRLRDVGRTSLGGGGGRIPVTAVSLTVVVKTNIKLDYI